jgi:hypothetical protein
MIAAMVPRRMRVLIVVVFLGLTIAFLTNKQYDGALLKKLKDSQIGDDGSVATLKSGSAEEKADASESASLAPVSGSLTESATASPAATAETTSSVTTTTSSAEASATDDGERDYPPRDPEPLPGQKDIDWKKYAYTQYVTDIHYLCNSVMIFETLYSLGSRAERVLMYPSSMLKNPKIKAKKAKKPEEKLLVKARDRYNVTLVPVELKHRESADAVWAESYTKLLAFDQTNYWRVIALDSDSVVLQNMDELFLLPSAPIAMPRAYWLFDDEPPSKMLSSQLMLIEPSRFEFERIMAETEKAGTEEYDMEVVNKLYQDTAMVLPHRPYNLITSEFRKTDHTRYLGSPEANWNPIDAFNEAKFLHFSDLLVPKPWIEMGSKLRAETQPDCPKGMKRCPARDLWNGFYNEFGTRRKRVCQGLDQIEDK